MKFNSLRASELDSADQANEPSSRGTTTDGFLFELEKPKADKIMRAADIKEIAKIFADSPGNNKTSALSKVSGWHNALLTSRAKSQATTGRVAR